MVAEISDLEANGRISLMGLARRANVKLDNGTFVPWASFVPSTDDNGDTIHWKATVGNTVYIILND
jgi:hypothetical protein